MAQLFVVERASDVPRWQAAFPEARMTSSLEPVRDVEPEDQVWVSTRREDWLAELPALRRHGASLVVLSPVPETAQALAALQAGAQGYAHALSSPTLLRQIALVTSHQGIWVPSALMASVVGASFQRLSERVEPSRPSLECLTPRERGVALAVASGKSNKGVARDLDITERTVKAHLSAAFRKLEVRDRVQLVLKLSGVEAGTESPSS